MTHDNDTGTQQRRIAELIEHGSLGGPAATRVQAHASDTAVTAVFDAVRRHRIAELIEHGSLGGPAATRVQAHAPDTAVTAVRRMNAIISVDNTPHEAAASETEFLPEEAEGVALQQHSSSTSPPSSSVPETWEQARLDPMQRLVLPLDAIGTMSQPHPDLVVEGGNLGTIPLSRETQPPRKPQDVVDRLQGGRHRRRPESAEVVALVIEVIEKVKRRGVAVPLDGLELYAAAKIRGGIELSSVTSAWDPVNGTVHPRDARLRAVQSTSVESSATAAQLFNAKLAMTPARRWTRSSRPGVA